MSGINQNDLALLHLLESAVAGDSLLEFIPRITPKWMVPWHLKPVADLFARAEYEPVRACVSLPPRHGKTELILHAISWWLSRHPEHAIMYVSYASEFATTKSKRALDLAERAKLPLRADLKRANEWHTISDGGLLATGVGGPLTGHGANLLLIDDPIKNREEAESPTVRNKVWEWFTSTAMTRVEPTGSVIAVHTRWHDDDLIGRLSRKGWDYINIPALAMEDDPLGRKPGAALWPAQWPKHVLDSRHREVGDYDWWSLYMGQPRPRGGRLFQTPSYYDHPNIEKGRPLIVCDPAATGKTYSDHSAIVVGLGWLDETTGLPHIDILEVLRMQVDIPVLARYLQEIQAKWGAPVAIEAVGGFRAVPQMLREINKTLRIIELQATTDKFTRSLPTAAAWNDGRIRIPAAGHNWISEYMQEMLTFTGVSDVHDDQVDATAHLYNTFAKILPRRRGSTSTVADWLPFG